MPLLNHIFFRFYIGCESCSDWFHGRCVGILQSEADHIDEYLCPNCDPNSKLNTPNQRQLRPDDLEMIRKLIKQLVVSNLSNVIVKPEVNFTIHFQAQRSSAAFQHPVDPKEVPNYYKVIKEPMGKLITYNDLMLW